VIPTRASPASPRPRASAGSPSTATSRPAPTSSTPSWSGPCGSATRSWTDAPGDPADALARLVASSWQLVHRFRNILLAAQRELPAERIRGVHDRILRRVQSLIEQGQSAGTFRRDMPRQWLITTTYSLMHAAAEDAAAGRLDAGDAAGLITATLLAAFTPDRGE